MPVVWRLSLYVTLLSVIACGVPMECPKWWHFYGEKQLCLLASTTLPLSWKQARDMCKSYGGDLAAIPDSNTNTFVKDLLKSSSEEYWIGLRYTVTENSFQWLDEGTETKFTNWLPNEPKNQDQEDCVYISARNESQWNNCICSSHLGFLCQLAATPATKPIDECPKGWHFYEEKKQCFLLDPTPPLSWQQARAMCRFYGGDLTTVLDSKTNAFLTGLQTSSCEEYWIGLHDTVTEGDFQWLAGDAKANFTNWAPHEPNNMDDGEDCVFMSAKNDSQWNDAKCTAELGYSCQRPSASNNETPQTPDICPRGWHFYEDRKQCFLLDPKPTLTWKQARAMCRSIGGDMTTIPDSKTNEFVKGLMRSSNAVYWIGLHDNVTKSVFKWLDEGDEANFTDWAPNEPSNVDDEGCVYISAQNYSQWKTTNCSALLGFSCQRDSNVKDTPTTTPARDIVTTTFRPTKKPEEEETSTTSRPTPVPVTCPTIQTTQPTTTVRRTTSYVPKYTTYKIIIKTGTRKHAGTDAWVSILIRGPRGWTRKMTLDDHNNNYERGSTDIFSVNALNVGQIYTIEISHDNSEDGPGWFLNTITIQQYVSQDLYDSQGTRFRVYYTEYYFSYYGWIARDEGDGRLYKNLTPYRKSIILR